MMKKFWVIGLIVFIISGLFNVIFLVEINNLNKELKIIIDDKLVDKDSLMNNRFKEHRFNLFRAVLIVDVNNVSPGDFFEATVGLSVGSSKGEQPIIILADSLDINGELQGKIDTFYTEGGIGSVRRSYPTVGRKSIFGIYKIKFLGEDKYHDFSFEMSPNVIKSPLLRE